MDDKAQLRRQAWRRLCDAWSRLVLHPAASGTLRALTRAFAWSRYQLIETWREAKRSWHPPVRARRRSGVLVVSTRADLGGDGVLLVPLNGQSGMIGLDRSTSEDPRGKRHGVEFWKERRDGQKEVWLVAQSDDKAEMDLALDILRKGLAGGGGVAGRVLLAVAMAGIALVAMASIARPMKSEAGAKAGATSAPAAVVTGTLMREAFGAMGAAQAPTAAAEATGSGGSLADRIYSDAMAASRKSLHEQGPPESAPVDPAAGDFGLGKTPPAGCDPALAFKVSE